MKVFTVGHSNQSLEAFLALLERHAVEGIVDVRSTPYSRYVSHFGREPLREALKKAGRFYLFLGDALGGLPGDGTFFDGEGHVLFGKIAATEVFKAAVGRLLKGAERFRLALTCGEEEPSGCHRHCMVGRVLRERGVRVLHIRGDGRLEDDEELARRDRLGAKDSPGQRLLFAEETPREEWRSLRPAPSRRLQGAGRRDG
ncbi:MAG: DUF488 domain-containing protein [Synergistales bacterium]|nr:DUF488 domain-containing protein [Synergistales bacterium]